MALWMEAGSEPKTEKELADLDAISALKESTAFELKELGNEYVKKGKKHYSDAIDCYTRAINQNALSDAEQSILCSNRAHVNLLLGNYRRALQDAEDAIKLNPSNVKALYRAAKASVFLNLLAEAKGLCEKGLQHSSSNEELKKLARHIDIQKSEMERRDAEVSKAVSSAKTIVSAFETRGLKIAKPMYQELTGLRKPTLDKNNILHWAVLLLYPEVMSSDFIEEFCETDMFSAHLDMMFSEGCPPLPWDKENAYTRDAVELYYEACAGVCLSKRDILQYLLEGTAASHVEDFGDEESASALSSTKGSISQEDVPGWVKINEKTTLYNVLKELSCVVPGLPVFWVVSRNSSFYKDFKSGNWSSPELA
ncbi:tetratricopeptide repeat protein 4 homolog [Solanum tuberosum]|uniref:tetratricopeptide repeat protein 4 homolog n=1 Tax=Solanum tuberosum TaxID=4113 RepID=UPI0003D25BBF|nr:PREDICTED: tetratricopeptide repeat protein 4 homolog [Solanum tuberosum]XP_006355899.1 PREDICTED: tetratricopeptide repeat protein 4 homolog [Solanum tuberosum]